MIGNHDCCGPHGKSRSCRWLEHHARCSSELQVSNSDTSIPDSDEAKGSVHRPCQQNTTTIPPSAPTPPSKAADGSLSRSQWQPRLREGGLQKSIKHFWRASRYLDGSGRRLRNAFQPERRLRSDRTPRNTLRNSPRKSHCSSSKNKDTAPPATNPPVCLGLKLRIRRVSLIPNRLSPIHLFRRLLSGFLLTPWLHSAR